MYFKKLIGKKVYLSPINKDDYEKYTEWLNDTEVVIGMTYVTKVIDMESQRHTLEKLSKSEFNFAIVDVESDELIGNLGFIKMDFINRVAEVAIFIGNKKYWGNGYGSEALCLLLDFGFNIINFNNINLSVYDYNKSAINCYKKIGFKEMGKLREAKIIGGKKYDDVYMDMLASEFESPYIKPIIENRK